MSKESWLLIFAGMIVLAIGLCFGFSYWQVNQSQLHWCDALNTLTSQVITPPANPAKNPSREEAYRLYTEFVRLKGDFGCTS